MCRMEMYNYPKVLSEYLIVEHSKFSGVFVTALEVPGRYIRSRLYNIIILIFFYRFVTIVQVLDNHQIQRKHQ